MKLFISIGQTAVYFYTQYVNEDKDKKEEVRSRLLVSLLLTNTYCIIICLSFMSRWHLGRSLNKADVQSCSPVCCWESRFSFQSWWVRMCCCWGQYTIACFLVSTLSHFWMKASVNDNIVDLTVILCCKTVFSTIKMKHVCVLSNQNEVLFSKLN